MKNNLWDNILIPKIRFRLVYVEQVIQTSLIIITQLIISQALYIGLYHRSRIYMI